MYDRDWNRIKALFDRAARRRPEDRFAFLRQVSTADPWLAGKVTPTLQRPPVPPPAPTPSPRSSATRRAIPTTFDKRVGPYRLVRAVSQDDSGAVYLADRARAGSGKPVLIRMIRPDRLAPGFQASFSARCRALARLSHPNIEKIIEGGVTPAGFPYIVTEDARGEALDRHCDRLELPLHDRLRLLVQICSAVDYLHRRSVVHGAMDVACIQVGSEGIPRLTRIGIPIFLRPVRDLAQGDLPFPAADHSKRSDLDALGALLYEQLCGHCPVGREGTRVAASREAVPPSVMVGRRVLLETSRNSLWLTPERICRGRSCSLDGLYSQLRGTLDGIAVKALGRATTNRYESAADLAAEIQDFLGAPPLPRNPIWLLSRVRKLLPR